MTQEEKGLLLKDLCARLPYGVKVFVKDYNEPCVVEAIYDNLDVKIKGCLCYNLAFECKPYLRPMSSMTEEERKEYKHLVAFSGSSYGAADLVDWLNKKMFAYRTIDGKDMFELGLALEAPEGMYK